MKVHKITLLVLDFEGYGVDDITIELEQMRHVDAKVMGAETADIGEWKDDNLLNNRKTSAAEFKRLFPSERNAVIDECIELAHAGAWEPCDCGCPGASSPKSAQAVGAIKAAALLRTLKT